jgi:hypothetical protein
VIDLNHFFLLQLESRVGQSNALKGLEEDTQEEERKAKQLETLDPPEESQANVRKRTSEEHNYVDAPEELDSIKAKLVAKKRKSQRGKS